MKNGVHDRELPPPARACTRYKAREVKADRVRETQRACNAVAAVLNDLPDADNEAGAVERMLRANGILRNLPWPKPSDHMTPRLHRGDARDLSWIKSGSIHLVVTSPPYWTLKEYESSGGQLGDM